MIGFISGLFHLGGLVILTLYGALKLFQVPMGVDVSWTEYAMAWVAFFVISFLFSAFEESA